VAICEMLVHFGQLISVPLLSYHIHISGSWDKWGQTAFFRRLRCRLRAPRRSVKQLAASAPAWLVQKFCG